jgi:hypothetical protein
MNYVAISKTLLIIQHLPIGLRVFQLNCNFHSVHGVPTTIARCSTYCYLTSRPLVSRFPFPECYKSQMGMIKMAIKMIFIYACQTCI